MPPTTPLPTRRIFLAAAAMAPLAACATRPRATAVSVADLESSLGGRIGLFAHDLASGRTIAHRADERRAMCSTFKWALAGLILRDVDRGVIDLDEELCYAQSDIVSYSPVTTPALAAGEALTVEAMCAAVVGISDNTAANLLLNLIGGPDGFTQRLRALGDDVTRLDRWETELNENLPGDPRDTTTPRAMTALLQQFIVGDALSAASHERLTNWMIGATTGLQRLRAGIPAGWIAGDKTGTSGNGAYNDVAFAYRDADAMARGKPILIACYINAPDAAPAAANAAHAEIGRRAVSAFAA
jgi:beta-lactamase class A